jgi:hypothetical protein
MSTKHAIFTVLAGLHLTLVGWSAFSGIELFGSLKPVGVGTAGGAAGPLGLRERPEPPAFNPLAWYGDMSGANNGYGFFAPGVAPEFRAVFTLIDAEGNQWTDTLVHGKTHEANLRLTGIVCLFPEMPEALQERLAASWAATMFGRHPKAEHVIIRVDVYNPPTMEQYRAGERPAWKPLSRWVYSRKTGRES